MGIASTVKNAGEALAGFLSRYSHESRALTGALRLLLPALPIGVNDKAKVLNVLNSLDQAADNIAEAVGRIETKVTVKKSDIVAAVREVLPEIVAAELAKTTAKKTAKK